MNLLQHSLWWLVPYGVLMLVMLHAMMEFTASLLVQKPPRRQKPLPACGMKQRLLIESTALQPGPLVIGNDCDLELTWEDGESDPPGWRGIAKQRSHYHFRLLLDETRHEVRINETSWGYSFFFGLERWLPRLWGYASAQSGPPGTGWTREIARMTHRGGWSVRPVLWPFQATRKGFSLLQMLTPAPFRRWPARRFWGILYPLSFFLGIFYLWLITGNWQAQDWLVLAGVLAGWWGVWGFLVWALKGFPAFWRSRRS